LPAISIIKLENVSQKCITQTSLNSSFVSGKMACKTLIFSMSAPMFSNVYPESQADTKQLCFPR
jgi:hypothetical protein